MHNPIACALLLRQMPAHSIAEALQACLVELCTLSARNVFMMTQPINMQVHNHQSRALFSGGDDDVSPLLTFFGRGDDAICPLHDICIVSGSYPYIQFSSPMIIDDKKIELFF